LAAAGVIAAGIVIPPFLFSIVTEHMPLFHQKKPIGNTPNRFLILAF
jgi:hypothetical protein